MDFSTLTGKTVDLYGADGNMFRLGVDGEVRTFEAVEDENDGYRSMLADVRELTGDVGVFSRVPVAKVTIRDVNAPLQCGLFEGWQLVDDDGHVWLTLGTDNADDYYPSFVFTFQPKAPTSAERPEGTTP